MVELEKSQSLEELSSFYELKIKEKAQLVREGINHSKQIPDYTIAYDEHPLIIKTDLYLELIPTHLQTEVIKIVRKKVLIPKLYQKIVSLDASTLDVVRKEVKDKLLDETFTWFSYNGGVEHSSLDEFVKNFDPHKRIKTIQLTTFIKPLVLLEVLIQNPEVAEKLEEDSSYHPHKLFPVKIPRKNAKKISDEYIKTVERKIAEDLLPLFSTKLIALMSHIRKYLIRMPNYSSINQTLGKYAITESSYVRWVDISDKSEKELDELYNNPDVKREVYTTLINCMRSAGNILSESCVTPEELKKFGSSLRFTATEYALGMRMIENFAINQLLWNWNKNNHKFVYPTNLTKALRITGSIEEDNLIIKYQGLKIQFNKDSFYRDSTIYLPFCINTLHKIYHTSLSTINPDN